MKELDKIPGNIVAKKVLGDSIEKGEFLHNYLFLGRDEEAKKRAARILSQAILCQGENGICGTCSSCNLFKSSENFGENHPDFMEIFPTKTTSRTSIKKSAVVEIIESTGMKSYEGKSKVYLIHDFETMTIEGQNSLLKTLEEPLEGIHFILLARSKENILPTVLSRANQVTFDGLLEKELLQTLIQEGYSEDMVRQIITYSAGSLTRAHSLAMDSDYNELRRKTFQIVHRVITVGGYTPLASWEFFEKHLEDLDSIFFFLESWARDLVVYYVSKQKKRIDNQDFAEDIIEEEKIVKNRSLVMTEIIIRAREYLKYNGNKQLVIESMLLEIGG